jgi:hypothetical protein
VSYGVGEPDESVVFFVILDADGAPRFEPQRISRDTVEGWSSALASAPGRSVLAVDDRFWVTLTEGRAGSESDLVIQLAILDGEGRSELHQLQAPVDDVHNRWPSFVELDDRVGLMWTSGTAFRICVGCIADDDLHFVLLDPDAVVPASDVVTQPHVMNGIVAPIGAFVGSDMLTAASLDFHASTRPATGALRCEPTG